MEVANKINRFLGGDFEGQSPQSQRGKYRRAYPIILIGDGCVNSGSSASSWHFPRIMRHLAGLSILSHGGPYFMVRILYPGSLGSLEPVKSRARDLREGRKKRR